jgi:hypothetical protein
MITIQQAHQYLKLVEQGLATPIKCGNDPDHVNLISWLNSEDEVEFICLGCSYKIRPGYKMNKYIEFVLNTFKN